MTTTGCVFSRAVYTWYPHYLMTFRAFCAYQASRTRDRAERVYQDIQRRRLVREWIAAKARLFGLVQPRFSGSRIH
jgi:hypothetical protein